MALNLTGLSDLGDIGATTENGKPIELDLKNVIPDVNQPRKDFNEKKLNELTESIKASGVISPILVHPKNEDGKYVIIYGERRYRASLRAGKATIPANISTGNDEDQDVVQLIENVQRADLSPVEIAENLKKLLVKHKTQSAIVKVSGKSKTWVSRHFKIVDAPAELASYAKRFVDYTALADLIGIYETNPTETIQFLDSLGDADIGRKDITVLVELIANPAGVLGAADPNAQATDLHTKDQGQGAQAAAQTGQQDKTNQKPEGQPPAATDKNSAKDKTNQGSAAKQTPKADHSPLDQIYESQSQSVAVENIIQDLPDTTWLEVVRTLSKEHAKGMLSAGDELSKTLINRLQAGEFATEGKQLYAMLAWLDGAMSKVNFDAKEGGQKILEIAQKIINK